RTQHLEGVGLGEGQAQLGDGVEEALAHPRHGELDQQLPDLAVRGLGVGLHGHRPLRYLRPILEPFNGSPRIPHARRGDKNLPPTWTNASIPASRSTVTRLESFPE